MKAVFHRPLSPLDNRWVRRHVDVAQQLVCQVTPNSDLVALQVGLLETMAVLVLIKLVVPWLEVQLDRIRDMFLDS